MKRIVSFALTVIIVLAMVIPSFAAGEHGFGLITDAEKELELSDIIENYRPHTKRQIDDFRNKLDQKYHLNLQYFYVGLFFPDVKSRVFLISKTVLDERETGKRIRTNDMGLFANGDSVMRIKADNGFVFLPYAKDIQTEEGTRTFDASAYDAVGSQYCYLQFSDEAIEFLDSLSWYEREYFMLEFYLCIFESGNVADIAWDYLYTHEDSALWGYCGEGCYPGDGYLVEWEFNENTKTLVIYGNGDIANTIAGSASFDGQPPKTTADWRDFCDEIEKVIIKPGITSIGHGNFMGCKNLKSLELPKEEMLDLVSLMDISQMFAECYSLKKLDISSFNTKNVEDISGMFSHCEKLHLMFLGSLNTKNAIKMDNMFHSCSELISLNLTNFETPNLEEIASMFTGCEKLEEINVSSFNVSNVTLFYEVFAECPSLKKIEGIDSWNISKALTLDHLFHGCYSLTELNLSKWNPEHLMMMESTFEDCRNLKSIDLSFLNTSEVVSMERLFYNCKKLNDLKITNFKTKNVLLMSLLFHGCESLTALDLNHFETVNVKEMNGMFKGCVNLKDLKIDNFLTTGVRDMSFMFSFCKSLKKINVSNFDTQEVRLMTGMFFNCTSLEEIDVSNFATDNLIDMSQMFACCQKLQYLDLTSLKTQKVKLMDDLLGGCDSLVTADIEEMDTSNVRVFGDNFLPENAEFSGIDLTKLNTKNVEIQDDDIPEELGLFLQRINNLANNRGNNQNVIPRIQLHPIGPINAQNQNNNGNGPQGQIIIGGRINEDDCNIF